MTFTKEQYERLWHVLETHTMPKEQFGFFTMNDLIKLIEKAISNE